MKKITLTEEISDFNPVKVSPNLPNLLPKYEQELRKMRSSLEMRIPWACGSNHEKLIQLNVSQGKRQQDVGESCLCDPNTRANNPNCAHTRRDKQGNLIEKDPYKDIISCLVGIGILDKETSEKWINDISFRITNGDAWAGMDAVAGTFDLQTSKDRQEPTVEELRTVRKRLIKILDTILTQTTKS